MIDDDSPGTNEDVVRDLLCGIGPKQIRMLCENQWEGGRSYTPQQVGDMTLDMIFMLLCDKKVLRSSARRRSMSVEAVSTKISSNGEAKGRAEDGSPIFGKVAGPSLAQQLANKKRK